MTFLHTLTDANGTDVPLRVTYSVRPAWASSGKEGDLSINAAEALEESAGADRSDLIFASETRL